MEIIKYLNETKINGPKSKVGWILVLIFLGLTIHSFYMAQACSGFGCALILLKMGIPWVILTGFLGAARETLAWPMLIISLLINASILYLIGSALEKTYKKYE